jgi:hypothetical protein
VIEAARSRIPGFRPAAGLDDRGDDQEIRGSTTILELLRMFPDGRAAQLMADIRFPCAHCGGAVREPLTLAAKRHKRDPRAVLEAFRALRDGGPTAAQLTDAIERRH